MVFFLVSKDIGALLNKAILNWRRNGPAGRSLSMVLLIRDDILGREDIRIIVDIDFVIESQPRRTDDDDTETTRVAK